MTGTNPDHEFGEGNYKASREHQQAERRFVEEQGKKGIEEKARKAAEALDGDEAEELDAAEKEGRSHARN